MQRIEGILVVGGGPVHDAFLELADVTVLTGRNDSGKTRLLRLIEAALNEPHNQHEDIIDVFGRASEAEMATFVHADEPDEEEIVEQAEHFAPFREALELTLENGEFPLAVRTPISRVERLPAWRYGRRPSDGPEPVRAQIEIATGRPADLLEPSTMQYLGGVDPIVLPEAVVVPAPPLVVQAEATVAVSALSRALRYLAALWEEAVVHLGPLDGLPSGIALLPEADQYYEPDASVRWLLDETPEMVSLHEAAQRSRTALELLINHLLPDFITDTYNVEILLPPIVAIVAGDTVQLALAASNSHSPVDSASENERLQFPMVDAASGYVVWLQLAIREACARANVLAQVLMDGALRVSELASALAEDDSAAGELIAGMEVKQTVELALASLSDPQGVPAEKVTEGFEPSPAPTGAEAEEEIALGAWMPVFRPRLYLLDEPEQRLHPALQRRAARWLADLMHEWRSQCVLATHSTAFMDVPGNTRVYELARSGQSSSVSPINVAELTAHAQLAREMGLDRGELLSRWRAYLFVEGLADVAVIEEFFQDRLERCRIRVLPVHGHRHHAGLLDMFILAEGTAAPIVALLDGIAPEEITRLRANAGGRRAALTDPGEIGTAAKVIDLAIKQERNIEILSVEVPDIFDLLDDDVIRRRSARTASRPFPGHRAARSAFADTKGSRNAAAYERFLEETYGVRTSSGAIRDIARAMKRRGLPPPVPLENAVTLTEQAALSDELRAGS